MNDCFPPDSGNWKSVNFSVTDGGYRPGALVIGPVTFDQVPSRMSGSEDAKGR